VRLLFLQAPGEPGVVGQEAEALQTLSRSAPGVPAFSPLYLWRRALEDNVEEKTSPKVPMV
jgi:hypothetical protein